MPRYNAAAAEVMGALGIRVVDVYAFAVAHCPSANYTSCPGFQKENNVHFEKAGYAAMAEFIFEAINGSVGGSRR